MRHSIFIAAVLCSISFLSGWAVELPTIPQSGKSLQGFVPKGWGIRAQTEGDLNKDNVKDWVLVLTSETEAKNDTDELPRLLVVVLSTPQGLVRSAYSTKAILCRICGGIFGDPFDSLSIERGSIVINHYGGSRERWGYTHRFRYQDGDWFLIGKTETAMDAVSPKKSVVDRNLMTGTTVTDDTDEAGKRTTHTEKAPRQKLIRLADFDIAQ